MGVYHAGVARFLHVFREPPRPCSYLSDRLASHDIRLLGDVSPAEYGELLARGWRRVGQTLFRPACGTCDACL
ncbi:MAG: arginyltransferase, partial [Vicinamibacterales bacterium]